MRRTPLLRAVSTTLVIALGIGALPAGCASGDRIAIANQPYDGPPIELATASQQRIVKLTAPSGGWTFRLDTTRPRLDLTEVFVTAVRPDPAFMQTQALVTHELATGIAPDRPVRLYARVLAHDQEHGEYWPVREEQRASGQE
jgi:hypothetical protein